MGVEGLVEAGDEGVVHGHRYHPYRLVMQPLMITQETKSEALQRLMPSPTMKHQNHRAH